MLKLRAKRPSPSNLLQRWNTLHGPESTTTSGDNYLWLELEHPAGLATIKWNEKDCQDIEDYSYRRVAMPRAQEKSGTDRESIGDDQI